MDRCALLYEKYFFLILGVYDKCRNDDMYVIDTHIHEELFLLLYLMSDYTENVSL